MEGHIHIAILLCIMFTPFCFQISLHEPKCSSNFDFQEKLLSKSVKMDHQMQILQELVSKQLTELQMEKVSINSDLAKMATELKDLSTQLKVEQQQKSEEFNKAIKMKETQVAFSVTTPNGKLANSVPIFTNIITNIGGGYNVHTGKFTCPVSGLYLFSFFVLSGGSGKTVYCYIRHNSVYKSWSYAHSRTHTSATSTLIFALKVGDVVDVRNCSNWNHVNKNFETGLTGVLITEA